MRLSNVVVAVNAVNAVPAYGMFRWNGRGGVAAGRAGGNHTIPVENSFILLVGLNLYGF
jgi:hypothetical protein